MSKPRNPMLQPTEALARWNGEGGAGPGGRPPAPTPEADGPDAEDAESAQLRMRVIALEGLVVALLARGRRPARSLMRERVERMASHISPRPGSTPHAPTMRAATQMFHLVSCSRRLRGRRSAR